MDGTMKVSVIVWCVVLASTLVRGEVYSSASDMKGVFQLEREMVSILGGYASKLHAKLNRINDYLQVGTPPLCGFVMGKRNQNWGKFVQSPKI